MGYPEQSYTITGNVVQLKDHCLDCGGTGYVRDADGRGAVTMCHCQAQRQERIVQARMKIPPRFQACSLENFKVHFPGADKSLGDALWAAESFVREYMPGGSQGLLLTGPVGTGKTHLAVAALRWVCKEKYAAGLFCDYRELLRLVLSTYSQQSTVNEFEILEPVMNAELLVLDELGAVRPSDWAMETISLIVNERYNNNRTTIVTTNYPALYTQTHQEGDKFVHRAPEPLGSRISDRSLSRLLGMCKVVSMNGEDYRQKELRR